ncbi:hypothetical protein ZYGR_0AD01850 [Zygosaccharomyces rouxii]|uniref:ZYRO0G10230p n=2 Tax=Zygosaccharomyces rouxii TaxID=4956 RepID=C5E069_ZYGRC|nr:uncharacterized protein ZYRO0G10230g [Zygosaccharomyces rouxii]KAH9202498.1 hypothetical protein LQ764DRAFT_218160 [Zygosaccharomyces rouxii]GAV51002.1 hypothetical protein ZYGR_0AD01850 [Zygosaccharomyces rouxii]CAR29503.1 ZYRO0G10230p [Zygosaccharomyces rouxii]
MRTLTRNTSGKSADANSELYSRVSSDDQNILNFNSRSQRLKRTISNGFRRSSSADSKSSKHCHKFRFWLNRKNNCVRSKSQDTDSYSTTSSVSTKVGAEPKLYSRNNLRDYKESVVYKSSPRHHLRTWLNDDDHEGEASSILEIRQSNITTRIVKAKHYISLAAKQTAQIASVRRTAQLMAFTGAVTAAAVARVRAAQRNPNASHGSIANDTMYSLQEVSNAIDQSGAPESDYNELNDIFKLHFQYKGAPGYFKRLKPLRIEELNPNSAAYKMYYKMKFIPNPPIGADPLEFYLNRATFRQEKRIEEEDNLEPQHSKLTEFSDIQSTKSVQTRVSTAKSIFWSFVGMEAESTKEMENSQKDIQTSQNFLQEIHAEPSEHENELNSSSKSLFWSFISGKS